MLKNPFLISVLISSHAFAMPSIFPNSVTQLSEIRNSTNSNLVADNVDPKVMYVMPPTSGRAVVDGLHTVTANVGFCAEMADDQQFSRELNRELRDLDSQQIASKKDADKVREKLFAAREDAAKYVASKAMTDIQDIDTRIDAIEVRLTELYKNIDSCKAGCEILEQEASDLVKEKAAIMKQRRTLAAQHSQDMREYEKKKALIVNIQENLNDMDQAWMNLASKIKQIRADFQNMYSAFSKMEGARAKISFNSNWDRNIQSLRDQNPGYDFKKMDTQNAVILTNIADFKSFPTESAIMGYEISGNYVEGKLNLSAYPENLAGNVRLSLLGTCPMLHPDRFDIPVANGAKEMNYGLTISYEYPSAFVLAANAKYNMYKMYQKIMTSGSSGGLFSSRSWSAVEEKNFFRDSFRVEWLEQDAANALTEEQRLVLEKQMRDNILNRLATIGLPTTPDRDGIIRASNPPAHGAVVLADALVKTCPGNVYCVGASMALSVLDAIFGNSSVSSSYTNIQDMELTESWSREKVVYKPWISTYQ